MLKQFVLVIITILICFIPTNGVGNILSEDVDMQSLKEPGVYQVGVTTLTFASTIRQEYEVSVEVWYPALIPDGTDVPSRGLRDVEPDIGNGPYPLIVYSHGWGRTYDGTVGALTHLVSYGFVVAAPRHQDQDFKGKELIDRQLDVTVVINGLTAIEDTDLAMIVDGDNIGIAGYDLGATTSLQMLGLLNDIDHYKRWCADNPMETQDCGQIDVDDLEVYRETIGFTGYNITHGTVMPDKRIKAVMANASCNFPFVSDDTLASVETPIMIIHGVRDSVCDYDGNAIRTFDNVSSIDKYLLTIIGGRRSISESSKPRLSFVIAFFAYHLRGEEWYADYLTKAYTNNWDTLFVWGPYEGVRYWE